eukprot:2522892-Rhodomonas_salina.2
MSSKSFLKVVASQMWWRMLHRGGAPSTNVRGAMEKLKAVWCYFVPAGIIRVSTKSSGQSGTILYQQESSESLPNVQVRACLYGAATCDGFGICTGSYVEKGF